MRILFSLAVILAMANLSWAQGTGPQVDEKIPAFEAVDQNGRTQTFESLVGENGLLLLFHRSADW